MRVVDANRLRSWEFVRLVGVSREVYGAMVAAVEEQHRAFGRPPKLPLADQVLLCLMYWREYRRLAAIGLSYGVSESTAWRTVQKVEGALLASGRFHLPGEKALHPPALKTALVLLEATEVPVQRPKGKKTGTFLLWQDEMAHLQGPSSHRKQHRALPRYCLCSRCHP